MMISPESYYEKHLKGKSEKQIMTAIRGLKQKMGRLKNIMEDSNYGSETIIMPSESTRLLSTRMYLERAKQALVDVGGTYTLSKAEQEAKLFDSSIPAISKVIFSIGGFLEGYKTRTIIVDEEHIYFDAERSSMLNSSTLHNGLDYPCGKEEFLDGIQALYIGEWRMNYMNHDILDGTQWELTIEFSDGHKPFKTGGSNAYPYNFDNLQELLGIEPDDEDEKVEK